MMEQNKIVFHMLFDDNADHQSSAPLIYSEEDLKKAEEVAYNNGYQLGQQEGFNQGEEKAKAENQLHFDTLIDNLSQKIINLIEQDQHTINQSASQILLLTHIIIKKILPNYVSLFGLKEIEATIRQIFSSLLEKQTLIIRLHPETMPVISKNLGNITSRFGNLLNFEQDERLGIYDCELEWQGGGALWSQTSTLQQIEEALISSLTTITAEKQLETSEDINE